MRLPGTLRLSWSDVLFSSGANTSKMILPLSGRNVHSAQRRILAIQDPRHKTQDARTRLGSGVTYFLETRKILWYYQPAESVQDILEVQKMDDKLTRRQFIREGAVAGAAIGAGISLSGSAHGQEQAKT